MNRHPVAKEEFVPEAREKASTLIWFDTSASTGTTSFQVLPYVDLYAKNQLLRDRSLYMRTWYDNRIFSDYIYRMFDVTEEEPTR